MTEPTSGQGPSITPPDALKTWLDAHKDTTIQLPVVVESEVLGLGSSWIGTSDADPSEDAVRLFLNDSAMGIGLGDRLRSLCGNPPVRCVVWLEGKWGSSAPPGPFGGPGGLGALGGDKEASPFSVRKLIGKVEPGDAAVVRLP